VKRLPRGSEPLGLLVVLACVLAVGGLLPSQASAARECAGLEVCIPVAGPWVAVPAQASGERTSTVLYQLSCPPGSIVGGLDAIVSDRALDVTFVGALGSPVNPGITTGRSALFVATYVGARRRPTAFRPFVGCIPTSGGGRGTTSVAAVAPGQPLIRRVRSFRLRAADGSFSLGCGRGERLVGSSHAVAFRRNLPPEESWLGAIQVVQGERSGRVVVSARRGAAVPLTMRVEVQVHALCARGRP
jgi:hypothetical protein